MQHEPVGRGPVAGVAICDRRPRRQFAGDGGELRLRLQPVGRRVVELRAVDIERAGNMAISRRGRRLLLTEEKRSRARVDQSGAAALLDRLDIGSERQDAVVDGGGEDRRRWRVRASVERQASRFPVGEAAVEDRNIADAGVFQRPVGTRGGAEIEHVHAGRHHDHVAVLVDAQIADQLFQLGRGRHHERHVVAVDPPAGLVVVAVRGARDMRLRERLRLAAVDGRADVEHHQVCIAQMAVEPGGAHQRLRIGGGGGRGEDKNEREAGGEPAQRCGEFGG